MEEKEVEVPLKDYLKRRGQILLGEEDLIRLLNLPEGYWIRGVRDAFAHVGICIMICGPELAEVADGCEAPRLPTIRTPILDEEENVIGMKIEVKRS